MRSRSGLYGKPACGCRKGKRGDACPMLSDAVHGDAGTTGIQGVGNARTPSKTKGRIGKGALVVTDKAGAYPAALERLSAKLEREDSHAHAINRINSIHSRLKDFMYGFNGVSTKHLQSYLPWFKWTETFKSGVIRPAQHRRPSARQ